MNNEFSTITAEEMNPNPFSLIGKDWMLISSGNIEKFNTMTASWGGMGVLWRKNVCFVFVRPSRYTYEFMESNDHFSLSFFDEEYRSVLNTCGKKSGRDIDKIKETGLIPFSLSNGSVGYEQAKLIIECKKLYYQDISSDNFLDSAIEKNYKDGDYHRVYVGEIVEIKAKGDQ
ncbi:MAG: flavin reductase family protein [Acetivibrionales bacterium]|nr:flavin reductase family protein [Clostridiaceae bacterium]